jgi:hypothetical protein
LEGLGILGRKVLEFGRARHTWEESTGIWKGYAYLGGKYWNLEGLGIIGRKVLEFGRSRHTWEESTGICKRKRGV